MPTATGPAALLASLLPAELRYHDQARAACMWLADVGAALLLLAAPRQAPQG